jgi:hypothetical protein
MRQARLMTIHKTYIHKTCLASDAVSIPFTYFLNPLHPSLEHPIQFFLIDPPQNALPGFKELIFVSDLGPLKSFFHCKNRKKSLRARLGE